MKVRFTAIILALCLCAALLSGCGSTPSVGDKIEFGNYQQQSESEEKTPIEWRVLAKDGKKVLLISDEALDWRLFNEQYEDVTWETSTLRGWLNNEFYYDAFSADERAKILTTEVDNGKDGITSDNVFLLSTEESEKYFDGEYDRCAKCSQYARKNAKDLYGSSTGLGLLLGGDTWWTRTRGSDAYTVTCVDWEWGAFTDCFITNSSYLSEEGSKPALDITVEGDGDGAGVRPAIWITY